MCIAMYAGAVILAVASFRRDGPDLYVAVLAGTSGEREPAELAQAIASLPS